MTFDIAPFRELYPWQGHRLDVGGGVRLHYLDEGAGEPLVMLHGNPTWSFYYRNLVKGLAGRYRTIVPDHVGMGLSDKPGDDRYEYTLERRVRDLDLLLSTLEVKKDITLVLHDWGGMIGMVWAMRNLERVKRIVLFNTAGFGLPPDRILPWQIGVIRHLPRFQLPVRGFNAFVRGALLGCAKKPLSPLVKKAYLAPYDSWANRIAVQRFVEDIPLAPGDRSFELVDEVSRNLDKLAAIPVFIGWGAHDFVFDDHFLAEWRAKVPHAEVKYFEDAGHYVLEDVHDAILPLVEDFLRRHPIEARS
ncbi:alpha/beta fold hydrolase [Vulgatibacter incomptus]|uniref:Haloalkane dehalogenase-like protein n=1 Tax=Vulgatibacter incomptus TaxID=1391653 RepID=A0A0K1PER7_9BACT|nr:alpha/beta fold hydrolase [Vulgatibacter incomptus]AKU92028.1 Haloalkane dehalogenase-like protein [Vulgatibacter incomptus]